MKLGFGMRRTPPHNDEAAWSHTEQQVPSLGFRLDHKGKERSASFWNAVWFSGAFFGVVCVGGITLELLSPATHGDRVPEAALAQASLPDARPKADITPAAPARDTAALVEASRGAAPLKPQAVEAALPPAEAPPTLAPPGKDAGLPEPQAPPATAADSPAVVPSVPDAQQAALQAQPAPPAHVSADPAAAGKAAVPPTPDAQDAATQAPPAAAARAILEPKMKLLFGGTFQMGSNGEYSERPVHAVVVEPFLIATMATTVSEWRQCVEAKSCTLVPTGKPDQPVTNVGWDDAQQYVSWLSAATGKPYRLPTEAEWEYAARAGTGTPYVWGDRMLPGKASCKGCGEPVSLQNPPSVDAYPANPFGLYGMGGGAAEWVADCWHRDYRDAPRDGAVAWDAPNCRKRVLRGGSWMDDADYQRVSSRDSYDAPIRYPTHGFRVVLSK